MEIFLGGIYHIKDDFYKLVNDKYLMLNHDGGHSRPNYFVIKEEEFYWAIPISSRVEKYKRIMATKKKSICESIIFAKINMNENAILLQNAFPIIPKYIKNMHLYNGKCVIINGKIKDKILKNFKKMLHLKENGINLFYPDVDKIKHILSNELVH